jgi:hypothetical protein
MQIGVKLYRSSIPYIDIAPPEEFTGGKMERDKVIEVLCGKGYFYSIMLGGYIIKVEDEGKE